MTTDEAMETAKAAAEGSGGTALFERLVERLGGRAHVSAVFGDPIERDGITVIPVARLRWFFGAGSGSGPAAGAEDATATGEGSGGGGGGGAEPIGYVEIGPDGATFKPITDGNTMPSPALVLVAGISAALVVRALAKLLRG
ncbi:MAG: sporulation protein [Chloroflexi bacterium]|nr:sporulation protein [Chloroflexota bacterium]